MIWAVLVLGALLLTIGRPLPAAAAPGDLIADVATPEGPSQAGLWPKGIAMDGQYLYYLDWGGSVLHRIDPPLLEQATRPATSISPSPVRRKG